MSSRLALRGLVASLVILSFACDRSQSPKGAAGAKKAAPGGGAAAPAAPPRPVYVPSGANYGTLTVPAPPDDAGPHTNAKVAAREPQRLSMTSLVVKATVEGRLARTEVTQVFKNHTSRRTEGTFEFTLPEGAAISRLAMDVEGKMMEGELVQREQARRIYENIVSARKDPALLEWQGGNRFKTQIFPIEANSTKTVILAYEQLLPLADGELHYGYGLPAMVGADTGSGVGTFVFTLDAVGGPPAAVAGYKAQVVSKDGRSQVSIEQEKLQPKGPIHIRLPVTKGVVGKAQYAVRKSASGEEHLFVVDHLADIAPGAAEPERAIVFAVDTSAGLGSVELERVKNVMRELAPTARVHTVYGSLSISECAGTSCIDRVPPAGATDLNRLLVRATEVAAGLKQPATVVLFSDGVPSVGELDGDLIRANVGKAAGEGDVKLVAVGVGHAPNGDYLRALAADMRGHAVTMRPIDPVGNVVGLVGWVLREPVITDVTVKVTSGEVTGLVPSRPGTMVRGEVLTVMGRLMSPSAVVEVSGMYAGKPVVRSYELKRGGGVINPLLANFWARGRIADLEAGHADRKSVVDMSIEYGVMSKYTSFLVLENDAAYKRFNVERRKDKQRLAKEAADADKAANTPKTLTKGTGSLKEAVARAPEAKSTVTATASADEPAAAAAKDDSKAEEEKMAEAPMEAPARPQLVARPAKISAKKMKRGGRLGGLRGDSSSGAADNMLGGPGGGRGYRTIATPEVPSRVDIVAVKVVKGSGVPSTQAMRAVRRFTWPLKRCFMLRLAKDRNYAGGELTVRLTVGGGGVTAKVTKDGLRAREVTRCVTTALSRVRLRSNDGSLTQLEYQLSFVNDRVEKARRDAKRLAELSGNKDLTVPQRAELMALYVAGGKKKEAEAALEAFQNATAEGTKLAAAKAQFELLGLHGLAAHFPDHYAIAGRALLEAKPDDAAVQSALFEHHRGRLDYKGLVESLSNAKVTVEQARAWLGQVQMHNAASVKPLFVGWSNAGKWGATDRWRAAELAYTVFGPDAMSLAAAAVSEAFDRPTMNTLVTLAAQFPEQRRKVAVDAVISHCGKPEGDAKDCARWLKVAGDDPRVAGLLEALSGRQLAQLVEKRKQDVGSATLIVEQAALLRQAGDTAKADLVLSELVEFAPHDFQMRRTYSQQLEKLTRVGEACGELASAVQLNPAQRNTFREMMALRRSHADHAKTVRSCIVDGVSKLPVQRAVSLVMTWEDPTADVDLHIHEVGGEEVSYSRRESKNGGFLYYDITDGFGPEIYVLGQGPKGNYRLTVVYYRGTAQNLKGTLTVIRNAGSPEETREDRPFVLERSNSSKEYPIGEFTL